MVIISDVFPLPLRGEFIGGGRWKLTKPFEYYNPPVRIVAPIGYITDGASIPRVAWRLIGSAWAGKYARAAVIHDYGYHVQALSRKRVDQIFLEGMKILGVSWWRRGTMHNMVRLFGWIPWRNK